METVYSSSENNENRWNELMGLTVATAGDNEDVVASTSVTPLSPKHNAQQLSCSARKSRRKRLSEDVDLHTRSSKKAKVVCTLAVMDGAATEEAASTRLPVSALTSAAALLQPDSARQLLLSGITTTTSDSTQQHVLTEIIASEIARLAALKSSEGFGAAAASMVGIDPPGACMSASAPFSVASARTVSTDSTICDEKVACLGLGKEFLPPSTISTAAAFTTTSLCDCGKPLCHEIGYPNRGSFSFPCNDPQAVAEWCQTLDMTDASLAQIQQDPSQYRLAYWHFRDEHRVSSSTYDEGKEEKGMVRLMGGGGLPDASLQSFVDEQAPSTSSIAASAAASTRQPSKRMVALHNYWAQVRRSPTLEP